MTQKRIGVGVQVYIKDASVEPGVALKGVVTREGTGDDLYAVSTGNGVNFLCHPDNLTPVVPVFESLPKVVRGNWDSYFMRIAREVSSRATCDRKHVGCVLVNQQKRIISTGYNGSVRGAAHCDDVGHDIVDGHCVTGDVVVSKFQTSHYSTGHRTVRELYDSWQHPRKRGAIRRMNIRAINHAGVIVPDRIEDVWLVGRKPVLTVRTRLGRKVKATEDHRFKTPWGWEPLGNLTVGDPVGLNGRPLYDDPVWLRARYEQDGLDQITIARLAGANRKTIKNRLDTFGIERRPFEFGGWNRGVRRDESHSYLGRGVSVTVGRERARRYSDVSSCVVCSSSKKVEVHHIDEDPLNDAAENLLALCNACHHLAHSPHAKRESVVYDEIASMSRTKVEDVYDMQTEEHHNFVGNGFVLHNCARTIHAEMNAVLEAARSGVALGVGFTAYITTYPCWPCARALLASGVLHIVYDDEYREDKRVLGACEEAGVTLRRLTQ